MCFRRPALPLRSFRLMGLVGNLFVIGDVIGFIVNEGAVITDHLSCSLYFIYLFYDIKVIKWNYCQSCFI